MAAVDRSPARASGLIAAAAALVAAATSGLYAWPALGLGTVGAVLVVAGVGLGSRSAVTAGAGGLVAGVVAAGAWGAPAVVVLSAAVAAILAWDAGGRAIGLGEQLGRAAATARLEAVHAAATLSVGALTAGVGYGIYRTAGGGQPLAALVFLVLAALLIASALT